MYILKYNDLKLPILASKPSNPPKLSYNNLNFFIYYSYNLSNSNPVNGFADPSISS